MITRRFIVIISYFVFFKSFQNLPIATIAIDDKKTGTSLHERDNWHNHFRSIPKGHFPLQIKEKWRFHSESDLLIFGIVKAYKMNVFGIYDFEWKNISDSIKKLSQFSHILNISWLEMIKTRSLSRNETSLVSYGSNITRKEIIICNLSPWK